MREIVDLLVEEDMFATVVHESTSRPTTYIISLKLMSTAHHRRSRLRTGQQKEDSQAHTTRRNPHSGDNLHSHCTPNKVPVSFVVL
jgi:hypothetical protein